MAIDLTPPDPSAVLDLITAFRHSQVLFAACELGLFDALEGKPQSGAEIASSLKLNPDATERFLGYLQMLGLVKYSHSQFSNTPATTAYLTTGSPRRMLGYINYSNACLWKLWDNLPDALREGTDRWKQTYGTDGPIFAQIFRTPEAQREFLLGMHGYGQMSSPEIVNAVDLSRFKTFVDLGGATGHLATAACQRWSNLRGVVFDLPQVIGLTKELVDGTDVADRVTILGGDFFADELPKGDIYAVGRILHDWTEAKIEKLLTKIYSALPSGGALFIAEKVLHDDKAGPDWAVSQSLNMLLVTEGKERTLAEYDALLKRFGFVDIVCRRTKSPLDVVLAFKA